MAGNILIYVEHEGGRPKRPTLEAASKAAGLTDARGGEVHAIALGAGSRGTAEALGRYGVDRVHYNQSDVFDQYLSAPHADIVAQVVEETHPGTILFPYSSDGKDIGSRLSARLSSGQVGHVVGLEPDGDHLDATKAAFGGEFTVTVEVQNSPLSIYLVRPNAFPAEEHPKSAAVHEIPYEPNPAVLLAKKGQMVQEEGAPTPLEEASIIVSGGRGLGGPEPFALLEALAKEVGGVVGASRAAVDAGWISYPHQVGQTGRTVKPQLYIAIGISGAVQHRVGMQTADTIIAINKDPDAPLFQLADLAVVGDLFQVVPALTEEIKRRKSG